MARRARWLAALGLVACGARREPSVTPRPPPSGPVVARVGAGVVTADDVALIAAARGCTAREALDRAIEEELLAQALVREAPPVEADVAVRDARWRGVIQTWLARHVELREEDLDPAELREAIAARRPDLAPGVTRVAVHALFEAQARDAAGRARAMARAAAFRARLVGASGQRPDRAAFRAQTAAVDGVAPRIEDLAPCDALGHAEGARYDPAFVRALFARSLETPLSEPFLSDFGAHVLLLVEERAPGPRIEAEVEAIVRQQLRVVNEARRLRDGVARLRARTPVEVDPSPFVRSGREP